MRGLFAVVGVALGAAWIVGACDGSNPPDVVSSLDAGGAQDGQGGETGVTDGAAYDAKFDGGTDGKDPDAPVAPVRLGIQATPASPDAGVGPGDELAAVLAVVSAGARAGIVHARWEQLFDASNAPVVKRWASLSTTASVYRDAGAELVACISVVDRAQAARPPAISGAWNSPTNLQAGRALIDEAFLHFGEELSVLSLGVEVDRYLSKSSAAERKEVVGFVRHVFDYARQHPGRPSKLRVGIGFNHSAVIGGPQPEIRELVDASDVAIISYVPLESNFAVADANPLADLDALHAALAADAAPAPPIVLQEVAVPSSADVQGTEAKQSAFLDAFFKALSVRRERHPIVISAALHDGPQSSCESNAAAAETPPSPVAIAAYCSRGVRSSTGAPKPAQGRVFEAMAAFSTP